MLFNPFLSSASFITGKSRYIHHVNRKGLLVLNLDHEIVTLFEFIKIKKPLERHAVIVKSARDLIFTRIS